MLQSGQNWELFGYDVRKIGSVWRMAWKEFLWGHDSPVKARLGEVVAVETADGVRNYQGGSPVSGASRATCQAILLPDDLVLARNVEIPLAAESE